MLEIVPRPCGSAGGQGEPASGEDGVCMELKPGYKQTEVGTIPVDWDVRRVIDIAENKKIRFDDGDWVESEHITDKGFRLIQTGNIGVGIYIEKEAKKYIYKNSFEKLKCKELIVGDVLICRLAEPAGRACILPELGEEKVITSVDVSIFRPNLDNFNRCYLVQFFSTPKWFELVTEQVGGTTHKRIARGALGKIPVAIPSSVEEQRLIAEALSDADALIEALDQLIAKKRQIKQGAMQELLTGKQRLPGFSGEWAVKSLGELFEITSSKRVFQSEWKLEGVPFYRARELAVLGETGNVENELFISKNMYDSFKCAHGVPEVGDMLVTGVGTLGKVYVVTGDHDFYFKDGNIIWFKIRGSVSADFLKQLYLIPMVKKQIFDASAGTTVGTYTISGAKKTTIPFPSLPEQTAIATILSDMDTELAALESRLAKARQIKQGMMQELLTGRIRLL